MMGNILITFITGWLLATINLIIGYILGKPWIDKKIAQVMRKEEKKP